jgi:hypothetical protein
MKCVKAETRGRSVAALALLLAAVFAPILLRPGSLPGVPDWAGSAVSAVCLLGGLWVFSRAGRVSRTHVVALATVLLAVLVWSLSR